MVGSVAVYCVPRANGFPSWSRCFLRLHLGDEDPNRLSQDIVPPAGHRYLHVRCGRGGYLLLRRQRREISSPFFDGSDHR